MTVGLDGGLAFSVTWMSSSVGGQQRSSMLREWKQSSSSQTEQESCPTWKNVSLEIKMWSFSGYTVSTGVLKLNPEKIQEPYWSSEMLMNVTEVWRLLGMVNQQGKFIPNLAGKGQLLREHQSRINPISSKTGLHFELEADLRPLVSSLVGRTIDSLLPWIQSFRMHQMRNSYTTTHTDGKNHTTADTCHFHPSNHARLFDMNHGMSPLYLFSQLSGDPVTCSSRPSGSPADRDGIGNRGSDWSV